MRTSETVAAISPALVAALSELKGAPKDSKNPHFRNDYASLESVIETARPVLTKHKLAVFQGPGAIVGNALTVSTRIIHDSGEWIESDLHIPLGKTDPQGMGSALTYGRRYGLMAMLNMPAVDDDGEAARVPQPAQVAANGAPPPRKTPDLSVAPEGKDWWGCDGPGLTASQAKKDGLDSIHDEMRGQLSALASASDWKAWCADNSATIAKMPKAWRIELRNEAEAIAHELGVDFNARRAA